MLGFRIFEEKADGSARRWFNLFPIRFKNSVARIIKKKITPFSPLQLQFLSF
jgi:hypothetical protein